MYSAIAANKRNTLIIMSLFVGLIGAVGWTVGYVNGDSSITVWVLVVAIIYALIQYFIADKLAVMAMGAQPIEKRDSPRLYRIVENLTIAEGMPMPKIYLIDDPAPNAFATGRDPRHAIVGATTGILELMSDRELNAVMAHEIGHVKNYDIRVSTIAFGLVSVISIMADIAFRTMFWGDRDSDSSPNPIVMIVGIVLIVLAPVIATMIQLAIGRQREYLADATGAMTTRDSEGLAMALGKLQGAGRPMQKQSSSTAHLFLNDPLKSGKISRLFSTHPPLEDRIDRLRKNATKF
ncbi:MAG: M48 family metalloprotease [Candidatus Saccharimonadaceae bacterium]